MLVEEDITTLELIILVTLGMKILGKGKIDLCLRVLGLSVEKKNIEPLNLIFIVKGQEAIWYHNSKGRYIDGSYKGVGPAHLVDNVFYLEYLKTCENKCYMTHPNMRIQQYTLEVKVRGNEDKGRKQTHIHEEGLQKKHKVKNHNSKRGTKLKQCKK